MKRRLPRGQRMKGPAERRSEQRHGVTIPAMMRDAEGNVVTGIVENVSASGALLTNVSGSIEVGATGRVRLMNLSQALRTPSHETMELDAEVVRNTMAGFGVRFLGSTQDLEALLRRAIGREAIDPEDD